MLLRQRNRGEGLKYLCLLYPFVAYVALHLVGRSNPPKLNMKVCFIYVPSFSISLYSLEYDIDLVKRFIYLVTPGGSKPCPVLLVASSRVVVVVVVVEVVVVVVVTHLLLVSMPLLLLFHV